MASRHDTRYFLFFVSCLVPPGRVFPPSPSLVSDSVSVENFGKAYRRLPARVSTSTSEERGRGSGVGDGVHARTVNISDCFGRAGELVFGSTPRGFCSAVITARAFP